MKPIQAQMKAVGHSLTSFTAHSYAELLPSKTTEINSIQLVQLPQYCLPGLWSCKWDQLVPEWAGSESVNFQRRQEVIELYEKGTEIDYPILVCLFNERKFLQKAHSRYEIFASHKIRRGNN